MPRTSSATTSSRQLAARRAPKVKELTDQGLSASEIASMLGVSERTIKNVRRWIKEHNVYEIGDIQVPDPVEYEDHPPEIQAMYPNTVEAFKLFYERFSGLPLPAHAQDWVKQALAKPRVLINCPPRHAKSKIFSVWLPLWFIARNRDIQILVISQTIGLAQKFCRELAYHLESNADLVQTFGRFKPTTEDSPWRPGSGELLVHGRKRLVLPGDLTVQSRGAGQQILGLEADFIVVDDPVTRAISASETERERFSDWFHGEVVSRRAPGAKMVVVGQRVHPKDLYGELASGQRTVGSRAGESLWHHINYPAVIDWATETVLWPEIWPFEELMDTYDLMKRKGDLALWETMYQQNPILPDEVLVKEEWLIGDSEHPGCLDDWRSLGVGIDPNLRRVRVMSIDPSPTMYAGLVIADVWNGPDFKCSIIEARSQKLGTRDMMYELGRAKLNYGIDYVIIERNSAHFFMQDPQFQTWMRSSGVRMIAHTTAQNKNDPIWGVKSLSMDFEQGRIRIPWGDQGTRNELYQFMDELKTYPYGVRDDTLMALWFIKWNWRRLISNAHSQGWQGFAAPRRVREGYQWMEGRQQNANEA